MGQANAHLGARRELKILKAVEELGVGNIKGRSCLRKRNDSWFRPPPGGPHTGISVVSTTSLKKSLKRSYSPPKSTNCLSSSIHGWAPKNSRAGIFTSSMNTHIFSLGLAPNKVLPFFISLLSIANCTYLALVWAEKFKKMVDTPFLCLRSSNKFLISTDFPTPDSPVNMTGFSISIISSVTCEYLIVSIVGTSRSTN